MGPWLYYVDFVLYPLLAVAGLALSPWWGFTLAIYGVVMGTFFEYVVHRWVLHGFLWSSKHQHHHDNPRDHTVFVWWSVPLAFAVLSTPALVWTPWLAYVAGTCIWFTWYNVAHHLDHFYPHLTPIRAIMHNRHHKLTTKNYGISTLFWDYVFGTDL